MPAEGRSEPTLLTGIDLPTLPMSVGFSASGTAESLVILMMYDSILVLSGWQ